MAKITSDTTLAQLSTEKVLLGISSLTIENIDSGRLAIVVNPTVGCRFGQGVTEAEAIENAFERIRMGLAETFEVA